MKKMIAIVVLMVCILISKEQANAGDCWSKYWAPNKGLADVSRWAAKNYFIWYSKPSFAVGSTYEHETKIFDKGFAWYNWGGYWITNLPSAYLDFGDWLDKDEFTIGSYDAELIQANRWYLTHIDLLPQDAGHDSAKVLIGSDLGYQWPTWCKRVWCVESIDWCSPIVFTAPAQTWWYK